MSPADLSEQLEEMERKLAFAEACADPLDFDTFSARVSALLFKWGQADAVAMLIPAESAGMEPLLYLAGRQPILPAAEQSVRENCAQLLAGLDFGHHDPAAFRLQRGPELTPLHEAVRDADMYPYFTQPLEVEGETVGVLCLFGFTDWILARRTQRLLRGLLPSLARAIRAAGAIEVLRAGAVHDELTGAYNRRGLKDALSRECCRAERGRRDLAAVLLDVDYFKQINDTRGHAEGDRVLAEIGRLLHDDLRRIDIVARLGGDEFLLLLPEVDTHQATAVAARLAQRLAEITVEGMGAVSVSVGVATYRAGRGESPEALLRRADEALYEVKRSGRGRVSAAR